VKKAICCLLALACGVAAGRVRADEIKGQVEWPTKWTVFAPFDRADPVPGEEILRLVPGAIHAPEKPGVPARTAEARRIEVEPGKPFDLADFFETQRIGNVAYVFLELTSPEEQTVTLGMGADWWLQVWVNGEEVFDTLDGGNRASPVSMLDHHADVTLAQGANVLAVRFITGAASATLALGGPGEFADAERRAAAERAVREMNVLPERFEDRLILPVDEQAVAMARRGMKLPETDADLSRGELAGLQPMPERQMRFRPAPRGELLDTVSRRFDQPVKIRLSKFRYPWEDRHLDAIVWTTPPEEGRLARGRLDVRLKDADGAVLAEHGIDELSPNGLFFSIGFPEALQGAEGSLEVVWRQGDGEVGRAEAPFHVNPSANVAHSGRVPLRILNEPGATLPNAPMTVGVPFPRGALDDEANVRLVDENAAEIPLQTRVTAKWSRFGPVKWLLCDFTVDLDGEPREVHLEYGPEVSRSETPNMTTGDLAGGFPALDAGRVRIGADGLSFDPTGAGDYRPVLSPQAMLGAFVRHEDGRRYSMPADAEYAFEEIGSQKAVVRRTGWYVEPNTGEKFCQFVTRFVFHRNSPVARIFHTWIFTGDGNRDRIADMGWRFDAARPLEAGRFLTSFDRGEWISGDSLVQFDYQAFLLPRAGTEHEGRTPGVLSAVVGDTRVTFGAKDFWQNFPSELELAADGFTFYNWPRRNPPARLERPVARNDAFRHRFVHEGETLDFRMPDEYAEGEIWRESSSREGHWAEGRPETANAQGIARTEEMFLYFADASASADDAARVIQGLNDESLRATVDPQWMTASGVFGRIHPRDVERFPEEERIYDLTMESPARWVERLGFYGMWLHGDYPTWNINLPGRWVSTYRTLRKNHHAYPLRWIPYVRSGDPRFLKLAENAARQMTDANFCHYATADVDASVGPDHFRRQGWWDRSLLPWAGRRGPHLRSYTIDCDYLWDTYYLTGYGRARDVALLFGELTQQDYATVGRSRASQSVMHSYLDMYKATFDPWFLNAVWEAADMHLHLYGGREVDPLMTEHPREVTGYDHWRAADQAFYAFTGFDEYEHVARNSAVSYANPRMIVHRAGAGRSGGVNARHAAHAWERTGDPFYLARLAACLDYLKINSYEGEELDYFLGAPHGGHGGGPTNLALGFPMALAILAEVEEWPDPIHYPIWHNPGRLPEADTRDGFGLCFPEVFVKHDQGDPLNLHFYLCGGGQGRTQPLRYDVYGPEDFHVSEQAVAPEVVDIAGEAGTYRVGIFGLSDARRMRVFYPIADPDIPEVFRFDSSEGAPVQAGSLGYWFFVPEGVEKFWIRFTATASRRRPVNRASVWDPDGRRVWDRSYTGDPPGRVEIAVPAGQDGKLWRATGGNFAIDPQIPPYFSLSRAKWFNPEE